MNTAAYTWSKHLCQRLGVPNDHRDLAILVTGQHLLMHRLDELRPETVLKLLNRLDAFRRPERIESFVLACEADSRGRGNAPKGPYVPAQLLNDYFNAAYGRLIFPTLPIQALMAPRDVMK